MAVRGAIQATQPSALDGSVVRRGTSANERVRVPESPSPGHADNPRNTDVGDIRAATRTVNARDLSMDKTGATVATRPLTPQVASTETQGPSHNPTAMLAGSPQSRRRFLEFSRPEPNFRTSCQSTVTFVGGVEAETVCKDVAPPRRNSKATQRRWAWWSHSDDLPTDISDLLPVLSV